MIDERHNRTRNVEVGLKSRVSMASRREIARGEWPRPKITHVYGGADDIIFEKASRFSLYSRRRQRAVA